MRSLFEKFVVGSWNRLAAPSRPRANEGGLDLGFRVFDDRTGPERFGIPQVVRAEHIVAAGRTGTGKSHMIRHLQSQDIRANRGFLCCDFHNDLTPFVLSTIAEEETRRGVDLSHRLIVIEPSDREYSVGLNLLAAAQGELSFLQIAELAAILRQRAHLDHLGARTEELCRNALHLLADNDLTLLELTALLTNEAFRAACLTRSTNQEVSDYFRRRYDQQTDAMQAVYRDALLNKLSEFVADPRLRHLIGQQRSTFSLIDAIDNGYWIILALDKGRLGEQAATFCSLFLTKVKNALFARRRRQLFTIYADEIQNLIYDGAALETFASEARKYGVGLVSAQQYLGQLPVQTQAALMAVGTHAFFQLSSQDADKVASAFDGGKRLAELLKNLPKRHMVVKSGHHHWQHVMVPKVAMPQSNFADLYNRCRLRWARRRTDVEAEIRARAREAARGTEDALREWE